MEDSGRIVRRKNASNHNSKYFAPTRHKPDIHNARMTTKILDSICFQNKQFSSVVRDPHNPVEYNDVFGGPPRFFSSRKIPEEPTFPRRSYDGLCRALGKEFNLNRRSSSSLPVFELPVYENSSLPVFELPVFGGSEVPVFEFPSSRDDLGSRDTIRKSSSDEFYADIFRGGDAHRNCVYEESISKSFSSKPSRSRSKSSSSNPSPHRYASSRTSGDLSLSALASKLRPIALSKRDRPFIFDPSSTRHTGYRSQGSDNVSVCSSSSCSPSQSFSDSASVPSVHLSKPRTLSNRMGRLNADDVFGGFPERRPFPHMQKTEEFTSEYKTGPTLGNLERTDVSEKCPVLLHDSSKNSVPCVYEIGCTADVILATKPIKQVPLPVATVHHMTQNAFDSSPSEHISTPEKVKSWRDWLPEVKYAQLGLKKDSSTYSSLCASHGSPVIEASYWAQEEPVEINLETPGRNSFDGEGYDIPGLYGVNSVCDRRFFFVAHNKNDNHVDDNSDIAIKEAIAWAKEKFQGSLNEGKGDVSFLIQEPNDKDEAQVGDGNIKGLREGGHNTYMIGEERKQEAGSRCLHQRDFESSEDHGNGSIDRSGHSSEYDDQLFICTRKIDVHPQVVKTNRLLDQLEYISESDDQLSIYKKEIDGYPHQTKICSLASGQHTLTDLKEKLIKEVTNDVAGDYNQQMSNQENAETRLHTRELEDAHELDMLCSGGVNQMSLSRLVDRCTCNEQERWNGDAHAVDCRTNLHSSRIFGKHGEHSTRDNF